MKIIAVDFDGTLCKDAYPAIGTPNTDVIRRLKQEQANGAKTILWTCREGALLFEAVTWCTQHDITFDAINENIAEQIAQYSNDCRKVYADEYWDDKAVGVNCKEETTRPMEEIKADIRFAQNEINKCRMIGASAVCALTDLCELQAELRMVDKSIGGVGQWNRD